MKALGIANIPLQKKKKWLSYHVCCYCMSLGENCLDKKAWSVLKKGVEFIFVI